MYRMILIALALLLALAGSVAAQTDSDTETNPKEVTSFSGFGSYIVAGNCKCWYTGGSLQWTAPTNGTGQLSHPLGSGRQLHQLEEGEYSV